jgi:cytochrome P450
VASRYEQLPGEDGWPLVGSIPRFARDPLGFLTGLRREHGPLARFRMGTLDYVLLSDPAGIEQVLVTEHERFEKHEYLRFTLGDAVGQGLLAAEGEAWRGQRQLAQPDFRPERIRDYADVMVDHTEQMLADWRRQSTRELHEDTSRLTLAIVAETLFGVDVKDRAEAIGEALDDLMARFRADQRFWSMVPKSLPLPINRRYHRGVDELHAIVDQLVEEREPGGVDLMSRLMQAAEADEDVGLTRTQLRDELVTFLLAGHETTALALTWTLHLLARRPELQDRLRSAIRAETDGARPTPAAVRSVDLLDAVVDEAFRCFPPVWAIGRQPTVDVEIAGRELPAGTQVLMSQWVVHRDPGIWEEPERFDPDRWLDGRAADKPRFAHFPFGGGPRTCIGDKFAGLEIRLALATILQQVRLVAREDRAPELAPSLTLRPREPVVVEAEPLESTQKKTDGGRGPTPGP